MIVASAFTLFPDATLVSLALVEVDMIAAIMVSAMLSATPDWGRYYVDIEWTEFRPGQEK
jgi:Ni/Fe-hydrogenase subunit HybB-like protein